MDCPFCKIPMRQGWFQCGMALWSEKKHALTLNPGPGEAYALSLGKTMFSPHQLESWFCPRCRKILLDASGYESNIWPE